MCNSKLEEPKGEGWLSSSPSAGSRGPRTGCDAKPRLQDHSSEKGKALVWERSESRTLVSYTENVVLLMAEQRCFRSFNGED